MSAADPLHAWVTTGEPNQDNALYPTDDGGAPWRGVDLADLHSLGRREAGRAVRPGPHPDAGRTAP